MKSRFKLYVAGFFLSFLIHSVFVTVAEAAIFIAKQLIPPVPKVIFQESLQKLNVPLPPLRKRILSQTKPVQKQPTKKEPEILQKPQPRSENQKRHVELFKNNLKQFKNDQKKLDQRIQNIKKELKNQLRTKLVSSNVSDIDKVPMVIRKEVLPEYLKQMRVAITRQWLQLIKSVSCNSCIALAEYRIGETGEITALKLVYSSDSANFDASCLRAIENVSPLAPLPFRFNLGENNKYLTVDLTFYFEQRKTN